MSDPLSIATTTAAPLPEDSAEDSDFNVKPEQEDWLRDDTSEVALQLIRSANPQPPPAEGAKNPLPISPKGDDVAADEQPLEQHKKPGFLTRLFQTERKVGRNSGIGERLETRYGVKSQRKVVFVGDVACGKTSFLVAASKDYFPEANLPTALESYCLDYEVDRNRVELELCDTACDADHDRMRPLSYSWAHAICICFAIDSPESLVNCQEKWILEVLHFCPGLPILLLGFKSDLQNDTKTAGKLLEMGQKPVTQAEAEVVRKRFMAIKYLESSAKTGVGVQETIVEICRTTLRNHH